MFVDMSHVVWFRNISQHDVVRAGGKGAALGELTQVGIPVPPGFVITAEAYGESVSPDLAQEILNAFDFLGAEFVAVRSSATAEDGAKASWAGELETYLNTTRETLIENIEKCWRSIHSERAQTYRKEKGLEHELISVAVVVQAMVQSDVSGIAFTVHPVTKDPDLMIIEACFGLGELIVGGMLTPDSYVVRKSDRVIVDVAQNDQEEMMKRGQEVGGGRNIFVPVSSVDRSRRKLDDAQVQSLAAICVAIEDHYGFPCDIEWAMKDGEFFILQSRPVTTL